MKKIIFITDGGKEMGMGHVQQSLTMAENLKNKAEVCFLTKSGETTIRYIKERGFEVIAGDNDDQSFKIINYMKPQMVIIDKIDVVEDFAKKIRESITTKLAIFTNVTLANRYAHIAVIPDYGTYFKNTKYFDEQTGTLYYYGPKYWVLRNEFYSLKKKVISNTDRIKKIMLIFGGSDPLNLTSTVLDELLKLQKDFLIDVVLGVSFEFMSELDQVLQKHTFKSDRVKVLRNATNVAELMFEADLVMACPGLSLFESLYVGTPVIAFHQNIIQKERTAQVYRGLIPTLDKSQVGKLNDMLNSKRFINPQDDFVVNLEIGQGREELLKLFLQYVGDEEGNNLICE